MRRRAENREALGRGTWCGHDDADPVTAPHELRRNVERNLLAAADARIEQVEEDVHARASGRTCRRSGVGRNERTNGRRTSRSRQAERGARAYRLERRPARGAALDEHVMR